MATWTQSNWADKSLEYLGVKGAGQSASSEDGNIASEAALSVYKQLRKVGLCPFAITAIPEWAQLPLKKYLAAELCGEFGVSGQRKAELMQDQARAMRELQTQVAGYVHPLPTRSEYF